MTSSFFDALNTTLTNSGYNRSRTENGALGLSTTGRKLLDLNFAVASYRNRTDAEIRRDFAEALAGDFNTAVTWLFFVRDVRGGLGERRFFRVCFNHLVEEFPDVARKLLNLLAYYGRWDDLTILINTKMREEVVEIVAKVLTKDVEDCVGNKSISLLAKWMPSENASSADTRALASTWRQALGLTSRSYRKMLSRLREHLGIVERAMSAREFGSIDYQKVPARANLIYNSAFLARDEDRRRAFLGKVEKGEAKINAATLFPHDIVAKYCDGNIYSARVKDLDAGLEAMWKALPNTISDAGDQDILVVPDGSGSMIMRLGNTGVRALDVANALAIYFAERLHGAFRDKYITFSARPQLVDMSGATSLRSKLEIALRHNEVANTNIQAVFELILATAIENNMTQEQMPKTLLIISDMEFDAGTGIRHLNETLFDSIARMYNRNGYKLPRLVFWNVNSRTNTIPVKENEAGVALVSGFSPNVAKMVMSAKLDPYEALLETLNAERYDLVREALGVKKPEPVVEKETDIVSEDKVMCAPRERWDM